MKDKQIQIRVGGTVTETIKRPAVNGAVCYNGKWCEVKNGGIDIEPKTTITGRTVVPYNPPFHRMPMNRSRIASMVTVAGLMAFAGSR